MLKFTMDMKYSTKNIHTYRQRKKLESLKSNFKFSRRILDWSKLQCCCVIAEIHRWIEGKKERRLKTKVKLLFAEAWPTRRHLHGKNFPSKSTYNEKVKPKWNSIPFPSLFFSSSSAYVTQAFNVSSHIVVCFFCFHWEYH